MQTRRQQDRRKVIQRGVTGYDRRKRERRRASLDDASTSAARAQMGSSEPQMDDLDFTKVNRG